MIRISLIFLALNSFLLTAIKDAFPNERKFTYTYQSGVLGKGGKELEIWSTPRVGRDGGYYARIDHRVEFEVGVTNRLQTAFYLNFRNVTTNNSEDGSNTTAFSFQGFSSEWKYQLFNPALDPVGFGLYGELGLNTDEVKIEGKFILDKKIKKTTLALNLVAEHEWELTPGKPEKELTFEGDFGLSYAVSPFFSVGFEVRNHNEVVEGKLEHSALFAGPVVSYATSSWWMAFTVLPQITALKGKTGDSNLVLDEHEKLEARLIFSFHI